MNPSTTNPPGPIVYSQNISQGHGRDGHYVSSHGEPSSSNPVSDHAARDSIRYQQRHPVSSAPAESQRSRIPSSVEAYAVRPPPLQHPFPHSGPSGSQASPTVESPQTYTHRQYPAHPHSPPTSASPASPSLHFHYDDNQRPSSNPSRASPVVPSHPQPPPPPTHVPSHARRSSYGPSQSQQPPEHRHLRRTSTSGGMPPPNSVGNGIPTPPPSAVPPHQTQRAHPLMRSTSQLPPHPQPPPHQQNSHPPQPQPPHHAQPPPPPSHASPQPTSQPHPPHQHPPQPPVDPLVLASAEAALAPMRAHLEHAWKAATMNVHQAMEKMNQDFTAVATKERQKNVHLKQSIGQLEAKLRASEDYLGSFKSATQELESLRKDYGELEDDNVTQRRKNAELRRRVEELEGTNAGLIKEIAEVKEENHSLKDSLQTAARIMAGYKSEFAKLQSEKVERRALANIPDNELRKDDEGMDVMGYMTTVLSAVTDKVSRQMESRMNSVLSEIEEQRTLRMAAEQRSMKVLKQLQEARRSSESSSPVVQQDSVASTAPETAAKAPPPQPRRLSKHDLPRMITMSQAARCQSPVSPVVSPQILAKASPVTRLPIPSESSTTTHVDILDKTLSPLQRKRSLPHDIHRVDIPSSAPSPSSSSPLVDPKHGRVPSPLSSSSVNDAPRSPPRKKSRVEFELDEPRIDHSPEPSRSSSTPAPVLKSEDDQHVVNPPTPMVVDPPQSIPSPRSPIKEEGEIQELEEGEVAPEPVRERPKQPRSKPVQVQKPFKLGISHIDLLYSNENGSLVCQMCLTRRQEMASASDRRCHIKASVQRFPDDASWSDLIGHWQDEHPNACHDLEKLRPSQIAEMKQRMRSGTRHTR